MLAYLMHHSSFEKVAQCVVPISTSIHALWRLQKPFARVLANEKKNIAHSFYYTCMGVNTYQVILRKKSVCHKNKSKYIPDLESENSLGPSFPFWYLCGYS